MASFGFYAGSFDPITRGHLDIVSQALKVFDQVVISIGENPNKTRSFPVALAIMQIRRAVAERFEPGLADRILVSAFSGAIIEGTKNAKCNAIVRGLRQSSDFNDEFRLNGIVAKSSDIPMVYFICDADFLHVASSTAKEMAQLKLPISWLVTPSVEQDLKDLVNGILP